METGKFYVWRVGGQMPTAAHQTRTSARLEADRLSRKHEGVKFLVISALDELITEKQKFRIAVASELVIGNQYYVDVHGTFTCIYLGKHPINDKLLVDANGSVQTLNQVYTSTNFVAAHPNVTAPVQTQSPAPDLFANPNRKNRRGHSGRRGYTFVQMNKSGQVIKTYAPGSEMGSVDRSRLNDEFSRCIRLGINADRVDYAGYYWSRHL